MKDPEQTELIQSMDVQDPGEQGVNQQWASASQTEFEVESETGTAERGGRWNLRQSSMGYTYFTMLRRSYIRAQSQKIRSYGCSSGTVLFSTPLTCFSRNMHGLEAILVYIHSSPAIEGNNLHPMF